MVPTPRRPTPKPPPEPTLSERIQMACRKWNWTGALAAHLEDAQQRIGATPEDRLRWLLRVSAPETYAAWRPLEAEILGEDLRACAALALLPHGGFSVRHTRMTA